MKKTLLSILLIGIYCFASLAQVKTENVQQLQINIEQLQKANATLISLLNNANSNILKVEKKLTAVNDSFIVLKSNLANTNNNIRTIENRLGLKIQQTSDKSNADLSILSHTVSRNALYWIISFLVIALCSVLLFGWLKQQLGKEKIGLSYQITKASESLREEQLKLDGQLLKLLDSQLQLIKLERQTTPSKTEEIDHTLALKVADEIARIEKNLNRLEGNEKDIKPILKGLERIRDNFAASGYEMVQLLNKEYDDGMNVDVINFINDKNLPSGKRIITRIIRPQVNFQGVLKQKAQVDVSQN